MISIALNIFDDILINQIIKKFGNEYEIYKNYYRFFNLHVFFKIIFIFNKIF